MAHHHEKLLENALAFLEIVLIVREARFFSASDT